MKPAIAILCCGLLTVVEPAPQPATQWGDLLGARVKNALGKGFDEYRVISYPTDNFGLLTIYTSSAANPSARDYFCSSWSCPGVGAPPSIPESLMALGGLADVGRGAPIQLTETEKRDLSLGLIVPKLLGILGINFGIDNSSVTVVTLTTSGATTRLLNRPQFYRWITSLPSTDTLRKRFDRSALSIAVGDVVVQGLEARIRVVRDLAANLDVRIGKDQDSTIVRDATIGFKLKRAGEGEYVVTTTRPLIILRLMKRQKAGQPLQAGGWGDWPTDPLVGDPVVTAGASQ